LSPNEMATSFPRPISRVPNREVLRLVLPFNRFAVSLLSILEITFRNTCKAFFFSLRTVNPWCQIERLHLFFFFPPPLVEDRRIFRLLIFFLKPPPPHPPPPPPLRSSLKVRFPGRAPPLFPFSPALEPAPFDICSHVTFLVWVRQPFFVFFFLCYANRSECVSSSSPSCGAVGHPFFLSFIHPGFSVNSLRSNVPFSLEEFLFSLFIDLEVVLSLDQPPPIFISAR